MQKVMILGSNGLLGQNLVQHFKDRYRVIGSSVEQDNYLEVLEFEYYPVDLTNRLQTRRLLEDVKPDIIINAAAFTDVDGCEDHREICWGVNVHAIENILENSAGFKPILVHISTDYVFDGEDGLYREIDKPSPRGNYARSKLAAENIILSGSLEYIIVRTQVLYGVGINIRPNFATWVVKQLQEGKTINVVTDQIGSPTYAPDLAEAIDRLLKNEAYGLFHVSSPDQISRYDFARKIAETFELDTSLIQPIETSELEQKAPRPRNSSFKIDKLFNYTQWEPDPVDKALIRFRKEYQEYYG